MLHHSGKEQLLLYSVSLYIYIYLFFFVCVCIVLVYGLYESEINTK